MLTEKFSTQVRSKRAMQVIVEMKERLPLNSRDNFMKAAFWDSYKSIGFHSLTKSVRETFKEETQILIERFRGCEQPMHNSLTNL